MKLAGLVVCLTSILVVAAQPAWTAVCTVPGFHPTIQTAVADASCSEIEIAGGTYPESVVVTRALRMNGAGSDQTFIQGQMRIDGVSVELSGMHISAPEEPLSSHSGGEVDGFDLVVVPGAAAAAVFADGFESGDLSAWSFSTN